MLFRSSCTTQVSLSFSKFSSGTLVAGQSFSKTNLGKIWTTHQNNARTVLRNERRTTRYMQLAEGYKKGSKNGVQSGSASSVMDAPEMYEPSSPTSADGDE